MHTYSSHHLIGLPSYGHNAQTQIWELFTHWRNHRTSFSLTFVTFFCFSLHTWPSACISDDVKKRSKVVNQLMSWVYLCVLCGDLQQQGESVVVEGFVEGHQRSVDTALIKVATVLFQPDGLNPADHTLVTPHQHFWNDTSPARV